MTNSPNILGLRTAFFFNQEIERPDKYFWGLLELIPEFDMMPTTQPLPDGIKTNGIPLMTFKSQSGVFACEIKLDRLDLFILLENHFGVYGYDQIFSLYKEISHKITNYIASQPSITIKRMGMVGDYLIPTNEPIAHLHRMKNLPIEEDVIEFALRTNKRKQYADLQCNDILIFDVAQIPLSNRNTLNGVILSRDINNVPTHALTNETMFEFLEQVQEELSEARFKALAHVNE
ncbi:hypothetical protein L1D18_15035 [Vibrio parahaemolyticus]|uniref:hypothetical protein n=1 Tax=Vibrio parahaemolyticus TaxID=670 RepID=UPI00193E16AB|nr:hypothetical protein [Vibrio parahaemolyticus]EHA1096509.1 hypothetical protein [Vibrio alginolyticus]EHA1118606.1 hypothetical protein [Vibrio alginolyticus]EII2399318.1 hypothetical protein [Vibrio parahaemolyticus]MBM5031644.1 hypothetical protein [Vibrio parahaemolyticus]MCG9645424.1 hypothetical protein [Vibrio parahaemolyticus]